MIDPKKFIQLSLVTLIFIGIIGYAYYRSKDAIWGTTITTSIEDGSTLENNLLTITGSAPNSSQFTINGRLLLLDKKGDFIDSLLLQDGYNIIELKASDRFGRTKTKILRLYTKQNVL